VSHLAIDPDTKGSGVALIGKRKGSGYVLAAGCAYDHGLSAKKKKTALLTWQLEKVQEVILQAWAIAREEDDPIERVTVEGQQAYSKSRVDPNGLLKLALVSGAAMLAGTRIGCPVTLVLPRDWKGQQSKVATWRRVLRWVEWEWFETRPRSRGEQPRVEFSIPTHVKILGSIPISHRKEVLDALALGQWSLNHRHRKHE